MTTRPATVLVDKTKPYLRKAFSVNFFLPSPLLSRETSAVVSWDVRLGCDGMHAAGYGAAGYLYDVRARYDTRGKRVRP